MARNALTLAILFLILSTITLPFQEIGSASYVVNILALMISIIFLMLIIYLLKRKVIE